MKTHMLKTWPEFFDALWNGQKTFELRVNDRDFHVGDRLILQEYDKSSDWYSGRSIYATVGFMIQGRFGLAPDVCAMSLLDMQREVDE